MAGEPYLYLSGLRALAPKLHGSEVLHVGIRPFGFHCGNALSLVAYPYLLCEEFERGGDTACFTLIVSINDWEQYKAAGPCPARYPYNMLPESHTIQYTQAAGSYERTVVDEWQPIIESGFAPIRDRFPQVRIRFVRNSELKPSRTFRALIPQTLRLGPEIGALLGQYTRFSVLDSPPPSYANGVCPLCTFATGRTTVVVGKIKVDCTQCGMVAVAPYEDFDYWWHHKPMFVARWVHFGLDVAISGADHLEDGDVEVRHQLRRLFNLPRRRLTMLFTPKVLDDEGHKMSKTLDNEVTVKVDDLISYARQFSESEFRVGAVFGSKPDK